MNTNVIKPIGPVMHHHMGELSPQQVRLRAFDKLQEYIDKGRQRATVAVQRILSEQAVDRVARLSALVAEPAGNEFTLSSRNASGTMGLGGLHDHALRQVSERLGLPTKYLNELRTSEWGRALVAKNLNELALHADAKDRVLVRAVDGKVRGVLSASYRTDDSRPALDALIGVAQQLNAVICDGDALDVRTSIKMVVAQPVELFPGEYAVFGLDYRNSDYGAGARELCGFILRLLCLNGAVTTSSFRRVHLGARIQDEIEYSNRTRKLNADFTASAARDMARSLLGPESVAKMVASVREANASILDPDQAIASIKKSVNKDEQKLIVDKYNSPDIELLPAGNTKWRFSNAISWLAGEVEDAGRKLELQSLAGEVLA
jgi:hypothetical protein